MSRLLSGAPTLTATGDLKSNDLSVFATTENLTSFTLLNETVATGQTITLSSFKIEGNDGLTTFNISGFSGLTCKDDDKSTHIPSTWQKLKRLATVNLSNCGLNLEQIDDILKSFVAAVNGDLANGQASGLGTGVAPATTKTILINGASNAAYYPSPNAVRSEIAALGWTLTTN